MTRRSRVSPAGTAALRALASRGALPRHPSGSGWGENEPDGLPIVSDRAAGLVIDLGYAVVGAVPDAPSPGSELRLTGAGQLHLVDLEQTMPRTSLRER